MPRHYLIHLCGFVAVTVQATALFAAEPLIPPQIVDMKIIGAMGEVTNSIVYDLLLNGNYLYCSMTQNGGLKTLDVSNPASMVLTDGEWVGSTNGGGQAYGLGMKGNVLYLANWSSNVGLRVFSITDPARPLLIRTLSTTEASWYLCVEGNLLCIAVSNGYDVAGIDIFDISNPSVPVFKKFLPSTHRLVGRPAVYGNYLYMISNNWLQVYNISNPANPAFVRQLTFNARTGTSIGGALKIKDGYLYMTADDDTYPDPDWLDGGVYVFSLANPSNPQQIGYYDWPQFKGMHLQGVFGIFLTGLGALALDLTNPSQMSPFWYAGMEWPGTGIGGFENCAAGSGDYVFVGCGQHSDCTQCGGRVYAVRVQVPMAPTIQEVVPDPDPVYAGRPYSKQLALLSGTISPSWSVVQAPAGTQVSSRGLVSGWTPGANQVGSPQTICIRCTNVDGFDDECWQVKVRSIADFDQDDDVDQADFGAMQRCLSGALDYPAGCGLFDFNDDGHVETADVELFVGCMVGPVGSPAAESGENEEVKMIASKCQTKTIFVAALAGLAGMTSPIIGKDILNPPQIVGMVNISAEGSFPTSITDELLLNGNYLYCAMTQGAVLATLNVSDPTHMTLMSPEWSDGGGGSGQAHGLARKGNYLYMTNWSPSIGLRVFDITNPAHPSLLRTIPTWESSWDINADGNLLFVTISGGNGVNGIEIFDISTPSDPRHLYNLEAVTKGPGQAARFGNYLYMPVRNWLYVYNISDPSHPAFVGALTFNASTTGARTSVRDGYLYMAPSDNSMYGWTDGGLYILSLANPANPQPVVGGYYKTAACKDVYLQDRYCMIPTGGTGVLGLDVSDRSNVLGLWQTEMECGGNTALAGLEECVAGAGDYIYVGVVQHSGCNPHDVCTECGGRVYAVRVQIPMAPTIAEVTPDPDSIYAGQPYSKQLTLLAGKLSPSWSVVQAPPGTQVSSDGLVSGWMGAVNQIGTPVTMCIRCTNEDGFDDECWQVKVRSVADFDLDDDVDQEDFGAMQRCLAGALDIPAGCGLFDFNLDGHVEAADVEVFVDCMAGPGRQPGC